MRQHKGFTITELMFAMTFLTVLLIILLGSILQITRTYNKGVTLKRVNQSGRAIGEELQRSIKSTNVQNVFIHNLHVDRLCAGNTSFVWLNNQSDDWAKGLNRYINPFGESAVEGFVKVDANLCGDNVWKKVPIEKATQLMDDGLMMRNLQATKNGKLVNITYTIGTSEEEYITSDSCKGGSGDDFCAINRFSVTVYARGY